MKNTLFSGAEATSTPARSTQQVWSVGSLMQAVADALAARFGTVRVQGEISGFTRAASGHCYFSLKDADGQVRCAMFRRAAVALRALPRDGDRVEATGRLDVYGPRGDLQFIVESLQPAGQGAWYERFLRLKAQLEQEGLFDPARKRPLPPMPQSIGVVTSLGAAALRDVATALRRRVPHIPVSLFPASVQGAAAPAELCNALQAAYRLHAQCGQPQVLLLVRGGGSIEDLWAFNDEQLARLIAQAPMPVVAGVGHETDFTIADFVADMRAPTPTAAAELCAADRDSLLSLLARAQERLVGVVHNRLDTQAQRLDRLGLQLARPSDHVHAQARVLVSLSHRLEHALLQKTKRESQRIQAVKPVFYQNFMRHIERQHHRLARCETALAALDPRLVLQRGYAWLQTEAGTPLTRAADAVPGQHLVASLADGEVDLTVR